MNTFHRLFPGLTALDVIGFTYILVLIIISALYLVRQDALFAHEGQYCRVANGAITFDCRSGEPTPTR